jgi:hypothetical protein
MLLQVLDLTQGGTGSWRARDLNSPERGDGSGGQSAIAALAAALPLLPRLVQLDLDGFRT